MGLKHNVELGDLYIDDAGAIYRVIGYQPNPTVHLERLTDAAAKPIHDRENAQLFETHAVGCLNAERFRPLKASE